MRWLFVAVIIALFELLSYGAARSLIWGLAPHLTAWHSRLLFWGVFGISHALLILALLRAFPTALKLSMTWLALLWLVILSALLARAADWLLVQSLPQWAAQPAYPHWGTTILLTLTLIGLTGRALFNAYVPTVRHLTLKTAQPLAQPLRLAMVSDLHLGALVGNRQIDRLSDILQREQVQLLLMPGDIMDDEPTEFHRRGMQPHLAQLVSHVPLGVYATLGNHDLYGHRAANTLALQASGIQVLDDARVLVNDQVWLVGRLDDHVRDRKPTRDLLPAAPQHPVIVLDHEPSQISSNAKLPIDLQVSGHTHNGQIFPANLIVQRMYQVAYGHAQINQMHVLVSSGYGFWGVPFRLGSRAEVWVIDLVGS